MTLLAWHESYETGDEAIDEQHRGLISLLDELAAVSGVSHSEPEVLRIFDRLTEFTQSHFQMEEELMARSGYPPRDAADMIEQHRDFIMYVRIAVLDLRTGRLDHDSFFRLLAERLARNEFESDKKLAAHLSAASHVRGRTHR